MAQKINIKTKTNVNESIKKKKEGERENTTTQQRYSAILTMHAKDERRVFRTYHHQAQRWSGAASRERLRLRNACEGWSVAIDK